MKDYLYLVLAPSGSGKTYIIDKLCKDFNLKEVKSRTTRKPRFKGEDNHTFVSCQQANIELRKNNVVAHTVYNNERYYTLTEDLVDIDFYTIDVSGVKNIVESKLDDRVPCTLFIKTNFIRRIINMRKRGDKFKDIFTRLKYDYKEFKGFEGDYNFKNSDEVYEFIKVRKSL